MLSHLRLHAAQRATVHQFSEQSIEQSAEMESKSNGQRPRFGIIIAIYFYIIIQLLGYYGPIIVFEHRH